MASICTQMMVTVTDKVGRLAELTDKVKAAGVNILALCAWVEGDQGHLLMSADDNDKACAAIKDAVASCEATEGICLTAPNQPGALNEIAHKLADAGIAIQMAFATAGGGDEALIVMTTTDNAKAVEVL